jgi:hypothetical protein
LKTLGLALVLPDDECCEARAKDNNRDLHVRELLPNVSEMLLRSYVTVAILLLYTSSHRIPFTPASAFPVQILVRHL